MNIRTKITGFQIFFVCFIFIMAAVVYFAIDRANYYIGRVAATHRQLQTITALSLHANRYSEQIAEMLLFGRQGRAEFEEARRDLELSFSELEDLTLQEIDFVEEEEEKAAEIEELDVVAEMRAMVAQIHTIALELLEIREQGRLQEAYERYYAEIEERLDDDLQVLIDLAIEDERQEVEATDYRTAVLGQRLALAVLAVALVSIASSIGAVLLLSRAVARPIQKLMRGAEALGRGDLSHRIEAEGGDELALLSEQFNQMAERIEHQQGVLLDAQSLLEERVRERTAQLEEVNQRLKDLDRLRVLFLADISHELRTPLTVLRGEAQVTLRANSKSTEEYRDTLTHVVEQATQMTRLVDDLLFLARSEADTIRFEQQRVRLQDVLGEAFGEGRILARASSNDLSYDEPDEPVYVLGDPQRLKQAALIALDNAVKYSDGKTSVNLALATADGEAVIKVRNHGPGIPSDELPYVFERFYRSSRSPHQHTSGSGLGLPIAKWIVDKHGGTIALSSQPDDVTELEIHIPLA
jgi:two-component system OmpR family sensor kinase